MLGLFRHRRVAALLSSYIDGQVTREERSVVEGHLPGCETCSRDLDELRQTASLMSGLAVLAPGRTYVLSSLSPQEAPARRPAYAFFAPGIAAAACAVLLVVIVSGQAAGVLVQSGGDEAMSQSSADAPMAASHDMLESQSDEPITADMAADDESFTTFGEEAASDEQVEEELALAKVAEVEVQQSSEVAAFEAFDEALSEALVESAAMEMPSEFLSDFEDAPAADEGDFMAMAPEYMAEESEEAGQVSSLEASARAAGSEEESSDDQEQPEADLTADVASVVDEDTGIEAADMAEESDEAGQMSSFDVSSDSAAPEEEALDDQEQPEAAITADAATVVDEDTGIEAADMAGAKLTPAVARSQPDAGAAQDDQAGGVELPLWQIEVGVGAIIALLLIAAYSAGRKRR